MREGRVIYVSKKKLFPAFGEADVKKQIAYVRKDLPNSVKKFVEIHEKYHLKDKTKNWIIREIRANFYAGLRRPFGLIITIIMSLSPSRLNLYKERFKENQ
jgi:hypothetical protein